MLGKVTLEDFVSEENEVSVLDFLHSTCQSALSGYETDAETDGLILSEQALTYNEKNCVVLRLGEKRVSILDSAVIGAGVLHHNVRAGDKDLEKAARMSVRDDVWLDAN